MDLMQISHYFSSVKSIEQVQNYLNGIIERQRIEISQNEYGFEVILHLINNDNINIPLTKRIFSTNSYGNMFNRYNILNPVNSTQMNYETMTYFQSPQKNDITTEFNTIELNSPDYEIPNDITITTINRNVESDTKDIFNSNNNNNNINNKSQILFSPVSAFSHADLPVNINIDNNIVKKEENKTNEQHKNISNELKKVSQQVDLFMKDINKYKEENVF